MIVPNIKSMKDKAAFALSSKRTVCCIECRAELWTIEDIHQYGTKHGAKITSECGQEWSDYWEKGNKTPKRLDCPICHENYLKAISVGDQVYPKMLLKAINPLTGEVSFV